MTDHPTDDELDVPRRSILPGEMVADAFAELGGPDSSSDDAVSTALPSVADALRAASAEADRDSMLNIARSMASPDASAPREPIRPRLPSSPQLRNPNNLRSPKGPLPSAPPPPPSVRASSIPAPRIIPPRSSDSRASAPSPSRTSLPAPSRVSLPPPSRATLPPPSRASLTPASRHSAPPPLAGSSASALIQSSGPQAAAGTREDSPASSPFIYAPPPRAPSGAAASAPSSPLPSEPWFAAASADLTSEVPSTRRSLLPLEPALAEPTAGPRSAWHFRAAVAGLMLVGGLGGYLLNRSGDDPAQAHSDSALADSALADSALVPETSIQPAAGQHAPAEASDGPEVEAIDPADLPRADAERAAWARAARRSRKAATSSNSQDLSASARADENSSSGPNTETTSTTPNNDPSSEDALMAAIGAKSGSLRSASGDPPSEEAATLATLGINSIPASTVTLDGKSLGHTPRLGVKVSPGRHVVVFKHPEHGQRRLEVKVGGGEQRTVSVRF